MSLSPQASRPTDFSGPSPGAHPAPFLRLRDSTLGYHGPDRDLTNLTEIRIGWFGPQDPTNALGAGLWWAANLAVREANEQGGLNGLPFRLVPRWSVDPWGTGISQLTRMVYTEEPLAVIGSVDSASTHLAEQVVAKANLPLVSPIATDKSVTLAGVSWVFACAPSDDAIARSLAGAALGELRAPGDRLALLATTDHESRALAAELRKALSRRGRLPDFEFAVPPGAPEISRQIAAVEEAKPAVVLIIASAEDAARLVIAARRALPSAVVLGGPSVGRARFLELASAAAEGVRFPVLFDANPDDPACRRFRARFFAEHQRLPDYADALTYDATRLLLEAIRRAGPNRARVREALPRLSPWRGIAGVIEFDGTGQNRRTPVPLATIRNGVGLLDETMTVASAPPNSHPNPAPLNYEPDALRRDASHRVPDFHP